MYRKDGIPKLMLLLPQSERLLPTGFGFGVSASLGVIQEFKA
jgi:hypothetical protein